MVNLVSIFLFIFIFMFITGVLYFFLLKNEEIKKRLNYYLDIENRYKKSKDDKIHQENFKDFFKNFNEFIRQILKKGIPGRDRERINQLMISAGATLKPEEYVMMRFFFAVVFGAICYVQFNNLFFLIAGLVVGYFLPKIWLNRKKKKRIEKFNAGLADMITTIIGSLKSGYSFSQAMKIVAEESESPIKDEIQTLLNELNYGITMEEALNNLKRRMPSMELELMIHATLIQRQIGGNLSNILEVIVDTIRQREKLQRHVRTLTAQGRLSGKIIAALPVLMALLMYMLNKQYLLDFLNNRYGQIAIAVGVLSCILGFIIINKITKIEV